MSKKTLTGDQAIAYGALEADVRVVTGYPGSPGTKVLTGILELTKDDPTKHVEWSANEKVAVEIALGASLGGDRAMVVLKSVGMNIAVDPIMTANLTGINAGLVIILGDDPGAWLSQNEQDTRGLVDFMELPLMEPSSPQEGKDMVSAAFEISERFRTIVVVREIRSFSTFQDVVELKEGFLSMPSKGFLHEKNRWVSTTFNVIENHRELHHKLELMGEYFSNSRFNKIIKADGDGYIIAAGFAYNKLMDALNGKKDKFSVFKLGTINPLPGDLIIQFLNEAESVIVLEDNEPYLENKIKAILHDAGLNTEVLGKTTGNIPREGEISNIHIEALMSNAPGLKSHTQRVSTETQKSFCEGCPYIPAFQALSHVIEELGEKPVIIAEPGCGVRLNAPPFEMLDVKYSMGSAIGIASGIAKARAGVKPIAVCGDSSFFHTGVNSLMNVITNRANIFIMVLDNAVTALTGYQPHPGTGVDAKGRETESVDIAEIAKACNVPFVDVVDPDETETIQAALRKGLTSDELSMVIIRKACPLAHDLNVSSG
jgi:indolepyruvate ferredoxin oxidoreductase alpha subunit